MHKQIIKANQRYLDMMVNTTVRDRLQIRSRITRALRERLHAMAFTEVETPVVSSSADGANARPFATRCEAMDTSPRNGM